MKSYLFSTDVNVLNQDVIEKEHSRRAFLRASVLLSAAALSASAAAMPPEARSQPKKDQRKLSLVNRHTGETLNVVYWENGQYIDDHVGQLNYFMRDHRANKSKLMDPNLYDFLFRLYAVLDTKKPIHVLSAYRTKKTNAALRKASSSVAKRSYHVSGRAIDFYIPGVDNKYIQREARRLILGGVGYYNDAGFIHIDTGYPRHWVNA